MTAICLASAKGSPGVTTSALLLAALLPGSVLVEADPAGGDLRAQLSDPTGQPLRPDLGVLSLLAAHRTGDSTGDVTAYGSIGRGGTGRGLLTHAQQLAGGLPLLVGPSSPSQATALAPAWPQLASAVAAHPGLVLLDLGRLDPQHTGSWSLVEQCQLTLVVTEPTVAAVGHTRELLAMIRARSRHSSRATHRTDAHVAGVLVIGSESDRRQVSETLNPGWAGRLPDEPDAARQLLSGVWSARLDRSPLLTVGRRLASGLHELLTSLTTHEPAPASAEPVGLADAPCPVERSTAAVPS